MRTDILSLPLLDLSPADMAARLDAHEDYRVLRRITSTASVKLFTEGIAVRKVVIVDVEATGLDTNQDKIIELALSVVELDENHRIVSISEPKVWFEDPGVPISAEITAITGIIDADVADKRIPDEEVLAIFDGVALTIAHNASYDAKMLEKRFPALRGKPWACSCTDLKWRDYGFDGRSLSHLLLQAGYFYAGHRADIDIIAVAVLLTTDIDGQPISNLLINSARKPTHKILARNSPFDAKDSLKARGYMWDPTGKVWWTTTEPAKTEEELAWLSTNIYPRGGAPVIEKIDWTTRHRN